MTNNPKRKPSETSEHPAGRWMLSLPSGLDQLVDLDKFGAEWTSGGCGSTEYVFKRKRQAESALNAIKKELKTYLGVIDTRE